MMGINCKINCCEEVNMVRILCNAILIVLLVFAVGYGADSAEKTLIKRYMDQFEVEISSEKLNEFSLLNREEQAIALYGGKENIRKISSFSRFMGCAGSFFNFVVSVVFVSFVLGRFKSI